jgi:hypothetical protein
MKNFDGFFDRLVSTFDLWSTGNGIWSKLIDFARILNALLLEGVSIITVPETMASLSTPIQHYFAQSDGNDPRCSGSASRWCC